MLNRRILRIKVFKTLYSYAENQSMTLKEARKFFASSCEATRDLYLFMLSVIPPLTAECSSRLEAARNKFHPTEEELHPNMKFAGNGISVILEQDPDFQKIISKKKLSWEQYDAFLRHLYDSIRTKDYFLEYMSSPERSISEDAKLFIRIFEEEFVDSAELEDILEDMSITWVDDLAYALTYCCRTMEDLAEGRRWDLIPLYKDSRDETFALSILDKAFARFADFRQKLSDSATRWDDDRLFNVDVVLIIAGMAEAECFPDMARGIIINEYVEISKFYSTPKSRAFVNGMLDELIKTN